MQPSRPALAINPFVKYPVSYIPRGTDIARTGRNVRTLVLWLTPVLGWAFGYYAYKRVKFDKEAGIYESFGHSTFNPNFMNNTVKKKELAEAAAASA